MSLELLRELHSKFIVKLDQVNKNHLHFIGIVISIKQKDHNEYWSTEQLQLNGIYWGLTALDVIKQRDALTKEDVVKFVLDCQNPDGGFGGYINQNSHILHTLSAIQVLFTYDSLDKIDVNKVIDFVKSLQKNDGSFIGDRSTGEIDARFSYCALSCLSILNALDTINIEIAVVFVNECKNIDGGYGNVPGAESHAAMIFCCVGALAIANSLHLVDRDKLGWWLAERQLKSVDPNGRPDKPADVCYSWWVLSSLAVIGKLHWINKDKMIEFFLSSQNTVTGGFSDSHEDNADVFHTLLGIAGLAILGYEDLNEIDPLYCMTREVTKRIPGYHGVLMLNRSKSLLKKTFIRTPSML
ncbi:hypothetical protein HK096_006975, partial [Nowakowskiella sp. JEL0078]